MSSSLQVFSVLLLTIGAAFGSAEMPHWRRLMEQTLQMPAGCNSSCPDAATALASIQASMTSSIMESMGSNASSGLRATKMKESMQKAILSMLDGVCSQKEAFQCVATHTEACLPLSDSAESEPNIMGMPLNIADVAPMMGCLCDGCPGTRQALANMMSGAMSVTLGLHNMFGKTEPSAIEAELSSTKAFDPKAMFEFICPLIHMANLPCFTSNVQCTALLSQTSGGASSGISSESSDSFSLGGLNLKEQLPMLVAECNAQGFHATNPEDPSTTHGSSGPDDVDASFAHSSNKHRTSIVVIMSVVLALHNLM